MTDSDGYTLPRDFIGVRLSTIRECAKLTQNQMGQLLECTGAALCLYENGKRNIPIDVLVNLSHYLCVSLDYLLCSSSASPSVFAERLLMLLHDAPQKSLDQFCSIYDMDSIIVDLLVSGCYMPNFKLISRLCAYLHCSADYLLGISDAATATVDLPEWIDLFYTLSQDRQQKVIEFLQFQKQMQSSDTAII